LSDFGGAKIIVNGLDLNKKSFKGTPNWMAPEVVKNESFTRFSDIWSIGCTVIEMATGHPPWVEHKDSIAVLYGIYNSKSPPETPPGLSYELTDFIQCCLKMNQYERYNVYELLRHPFITGDYQVDPSEIEIRKFNSDNR
jgi:serine/threonine protein kinase